MSPKKVGWGKGPIKTKYVGTVLVVLFHYSIWGNFWRNSHHHVFRFQSFNVKGEKFGRSKRDLGTRDLWETVQHIFPACWADLPKREVRVLFLRNKGVAPTQLLPTNVLLFLSLHVGTCSMHGAS